MTALARIAARLRRRAGLEAAALGPRGLSHVVRDRVAARGLPDLDAYEALLDAEAEEWQALLEAVVVPETWFFRDRKPFLFLGEWAAREWRGRDASAPVQVLSLPCASGEEAWSIAIVLAAAGLAAAAIRIEAVDLSRRALAEARTARYPRRALRGHAPEPAWATRLHPLADGGFEVAPELRGCVEFAPGNLVDAPRLLAGRAFDCIFSRNLLIYCDAAARAAALAAFAAALRPGGLLFLGHAEALPARTPGFARVDPPGAFAYRRLAAGEAHHAGSNRRAARPSTPARAVVAEKGATADPERRFAPHSRMAAAAKEEASAWEPERRGPPHSRLADAGAELEPERRGPPHSRLADAGAELEPERRGPPHSRLADAARVRALADAGRLDEAAGAAAELLRAAPADANLQSLLGVVLAARGDDTRAAEHLRRALYLDPACEEALAHLPLVLERLGERAAAARVRRRARRTEEAG